MADSGDPIPPHHCPGCGTELAHNARYPWFFCHECVVTAEDRTGRSLDFTNTSLSGGISWRYRGEDDWTAQSKIVCHIAGRPVLVTEAHMGGVVAQPVNYQQALAECDDGWSIDLSDNPFRR